MTKRFGEKRFTFAPTDPEANNVLVSQGWVPVMGGALNRAQWDRVKNYGLSKPAGVISPTSKPYSAGGRPENILPRDKYTPGMLRMIPWIKVSVPRTPLRRTRRHTGHI